ncbi:MAG: hypothetical protein V2A65_06865 [Candidatus Omnitrophota bacterium]
MVKKLPSTEHPRNCEEIHGEGFTIAIDRAAGRMANLFLTQNEFGTWNTIPGRLEIVDERQPLFCRDGRDECRVTVTREGRKLLVSKRFKRARFTVMETWSVDRAEALWTAEVSLDAGEEPRSVRIRQFIPWPTEEPHWGWNVWMPAVGFPKLLVNVGHTSLVYGDLCYGAGIPIVSIYKGTSLIPNLKEKSNVGLSLAKPFGLRIPRWSVSFDDFRSGGVTVESGWLKLDPKQPARTALLLHPHEGCWRPGLAWLVAKYPSYFRPGHPQTHESLEGGFVPGGPHDTNTGIRTAKSYGAKVVEIHHHYPHYGHYFPEHGTWRCVEDKKKKKITVTQIRRTIRLYKQNGIVPLLYIQLAGDGFKPFVEKKFPESIALNVDGQKMGCAYYKIWMMNADPALPFGRFIDREIDRFFRLYPEAGGLFWDQAGYDDIDSAHHDGITMVDNRPMYRLSFCYQQHRDKLVREAHKRGMVISVNGPRLIELAEGVDQIMAEGSSWVVDVEQYFCVARPMIFFHYFKNEDEVEEMFQKCLLSGGTCYTAPCDKYSRGVDRLFRLYQPLLKHLIGREWVLEPAPLEMPIGVAGNIFKGRDGHYYVTVVSERQRLQDGRDFERNLKFRVRFGAIHHIRQASYRGPGTGVHPASFRMTDGAAEISLLHHRVVSLVKLTLAGSAVA